MKTDKCKQQLELLDTYIQNGLYTAEIGRGNRRWQCGFFNDFVTIHLVEIHEINPLKRGMFELHGMHNECLTLGEDLFDVVRDAVHYYKFQLVMRYIKKDFQTKYFRHSNNANFVKTVCWQSNYLEESRSFANELMLFNFELTDPSRSTLTFNDPHLSGELVVCSNDNQLFNFCIKKDNEELCWLTVDIDGAFRCVTIDPISDIFS